MRRISARDAKNGFGLLMDAARAAPVAVEKYGRPIVLAGEEYEKLTARALAKKQHLLQKAVARR